MVLAMLMLAAPAEAQAWPDNPPPWKVMCRALETGNAMGAQEGVPFIAGVISSYGLEESKVMVDQHCPSLRAVWAVVAGRTYEA